ncbi:MAG: DEAD/DEAH box helicase [Candidatus Bathyarchaeota archaeon]|nr:DEAD/DEAH box helicase [Candidatus Bathyarchaeota archaeon]
MSTEEIFDYLSERYRNNSKFCSLYDKVLKHQYIETQQLAVLTLDDIKFLLKAASVFAKSTNDEIKQISYKIAATISLHYSKEYDTINQAIQYIFISLGQLPIIQKNTNDGHTDYFSIYKESEVPYNPLTYRDVLIKQMINRIPVEYDKKPILLTDFQTKLYHSLENGNSVSISAPTSSGKSFLLKAFISKKFSEHSSFNVVYIVPTRALISETARDFQVNFKHFGVEDIVISSAPSSYNRGRSREKKMFVLTQERYHLLLFDKKFDEEVNILIVDEAQKVSDGSRGITLIEVIEESIKRNSNLQIVFITPFSRNPDKFGAIFNLEKLKAEKTKLSPVSQNLFLLDVYEESFKLTLSTAELKQKLLMANGSILQNERAPFSEANDWTLLWAAKKFGENFNIVYCNGPDLCLKNAQIFSANLPEITDPDAVKAIDEAIDFLKSTIHEKYFLIDCLRKGVAYHHGRMPGQVRNIIERLFKDRHLKYVFCTSTLLEGVNFPAQNIFISKPRVGRHDMEKLDFWNLAGRAGRLLKDYYGNIYCLNVGEWGEFKPDPKDTENNIESILDSTLIHRNKEVLSYLQDIYFSLKGKNKLIEQAITKFIIEDLKNGKTDFVIEFIRKNPNFKTNELQAILEEIENLSKNIVLPHELLEKNSSIDPRKLQQLYESFFDGKPIIPIAPYYTGYYDSLLQLIYFIRRFFMGKKDNDYWHSSHTWIASQWLHDTTFYEIIRQRLDYQEQYGVTLTAEKINHVIENTFIIINNRIRFDYEKYLRAYIDVLSFYRDQFDVDIGQNLEAICENLPTFLEFGSYNKNIIIFQSLGLSRSTAISIEHSTKRGIFYRHFLDEADCLQWLRNNSFFLKSTLSPVVFDEINDLL